ncbi:MAG TPA: GAF domain-containing protein [Candidatus Limnocylindrales bacterium]|nr:GAF domain-containing protein [Candidatus Limnocylindrales bacterium]
MATPTLSTTTGRPGSTSQATQLEQLRFLHHVIRLATTARTWEELLETVVDGTRDALHADVSSLYLLDRDGRTLTLAATNGLDRFQIGRARIPFGEGVTGRVAASREPMVIPDVKRDPRFLWVRGLDQRRFVTSMLSVPLVWHDQIVGVLNVQTERPRDFTPDDVAQLRAIADLLAGIVERVRLQQEAERRAEELKAIDEARAELIALVTHELRTPLAVVRAYVDLLAEDVEGAAETEAAETEATAPTEGRASEAESPADRGAEPDPVAARRAARAEWYEAAVDQILRLDRLVDSILASVRPVDHRPAEVVPVDVRAIVDETVAELAPLLRRHRTEVRIPLRLHALADPPRLRQIVEHLIENAVKYAPPASTITIDASLVEGVIRLGVSDEGPGIPPEWRERIFEPYARRDTHTARGSGIGLYAAKRLGQSMGARLWCEPAEPVTGRAGARFVVALPAAVAV